VVWCTGLVSRPAKPGGRYGLGSTTRRRPPHALPKQNLLPIGYPRRDHPFRTHPAL